MSGILGRVKRMMSEGKDGGFWRYVARLPGYFWGISGLVMAFIVWKGGVLFPDSGGYIHMAPHRSALYPLVLRAYFYFFSEETLRPLVVLQTVFGIMAALFLVYVIQRTFQFQKTRLIEGLLFGVLLSPHLGIEPYCRAVLTEALAYPLWVFAAGNIVLFFKEGSVKACKNFFILTALLVLTRRQFLFLYPVIFFFLVSLFTFLKGIIDKKHRWPLVVYAILSIVVTDLAERSYHLVVHGAFRHVPFTGEQLIVAPFILIGPEGVNSLKHPEEKEIFTDAWNRLPKTGKPLDRFYSSVEYAFNYLSAWQAIVNAAHSRIQDDDDFTRARKIDDILISMSIQLVRSHPLRYLLYLTKSCLLSYIVPCHPIYGGMLPCFIAFFCLCAAFYYRSPVQDKRLFWCTVLLSWCNILAIVLVEPLLARYTVYTASFLGVVLIAMAASQLWPVKARVDRVKVD